MSVNQAKVRRKELPPPKSRRPAVFAFLLTLVLFGTVVVLAVTVFSNKFALFSASPGITTEGNLRIIRVPPGGNLQEAVNRAQSGDIIELQAGGIYDGEIVLPNKPLTDFVTIRSSAAGELPENIRVNPKQAGLMAKIVSKGKGKPAVSTADGAHHYRFVGLEFAPSNNDYIYNLLYFAASGDKLANVPYDLEIDRSYIHSLKTGVTRRALAVNSANTTIKNSYFEGFAYPQEETQAICGWTGTKNVKILNNYIEAGAENVLFGGSDPASAELVPQDIEIRGNYFNKPAEWKGKTTLKCLFELKNSRRVQFIENYLENNWAGSAFRFTVRNQDGKAPFSTVEDVLIKDNIINGAGEGINILGKDDTFPSQTMKNLTISNNLFLNIGGQGFEGAGYFVQITDGENILIANNTSFNTGNIATLYGTLPRNFLFRDNIVGHGNYGIHGHPNIKSAAGQRMFQNNVFVNNKNVSSGDASYPSGNFWVSGYRDVGFLNAAENDYRLAPNSRLKGRGKDKTDPGCQLSPDLFKKVRSPF